MSDGITHEVPATYYGIAVTTGMGVAIDQSNGGFGRLGGSRPNPTVRIERSMQVCVRRLQAGQLRRGILWSGSTPSP